MKITQSTAMSIVTEMKKIIGEDLTFMDTTCHIIACTDPMRIGDFHGGSERMLRDGLKEMSVPDDNTYAGTRSGINLTLELDGVTVGVVGITGKEQEVIRYGQVVKRMTEILLMENALKDQKYNERQARNRFLQEWMTMDPEDVTQAMADEGQRLGIRMDIPRRLALLERAPGTILDEDETARADHRIRSILREDSRNLSGSTGGSYIVLLTQRPDSQIRALIEQIQQAVEQECGHRLVAGIDSRAITGGQLKQACARARRALRAAGSGYGLVFYDDILLEIVSNEVSEEAQREFLGRLFRDVPEEKLREEMQLLQTLYACNGSISQTAEKLYLHKNTVQYKLNRIAERTGYDPRKLGQTSYFYLAMTFYQGLHNE